MLKIVKASNRRAIASLLTHTRTRSAATERRVAKIVGDVRRKGDAALTKYVRTLDCLEGPLEITAEEMRDGANRVDPKVQKALRTATRHIKRVARKQLPRGWQTTVAPGMTVEQRVLPLDRVGCYVPGGRFPLPSSLLMTVIPAQVAGVQEIVVACPRPEPIVLAAALEAGATRLFRMGGAQAIAAMAYGTETVPRVDKIVGPGNRWVAAAKALVSVDCGIDFYAGPTEIVIVATRGPATWIAADLIAQAEHDPDSRAILITPNRALAVRVAAAVDVQLHVSSSVARRALKNRGGIIITATAVEAVALANASAAEHLVVDSESLAKQVKCAGSLFVGPWSAQVAGDYAIGSNHVLPTAGAARGRGGLSTLDFVRQLTVQRMTQQGLRSIADTVVALARAEGLDAHAASIDIRRRPQSVRPRTGTLK